MSAAFVLAWLDLTGTPDGRIPPWVLALAAGLSLGLLALTRPLTAVALAVPFGLHGMALLARGSWPIRRRVLAVGEAPGGFAADRTIDATGQWAMPGLVDTAARLREPIRWVEEAAWSMRLKNSDELPLIGWAICMLPKRCT